jgi:hypothetical protein
MTVPTATVGKLDEEYIDKMEDVLKTYEKPLSELDLRGAIATLHYRYYGGEHLKLSAEFGVGKGIATSAMLDRDSGSSQLHVDFHYLSPQIASRGVNELHGRTADVN